MTSRSLEAAARLADVLARENAALQALNLGAAGALLEEKKAAAEALAAEPPPPGGGPQRAALIEAGERLSRLVHDNRRLLERALAVQNRVMAIIASAAETRTVTGYGAAATLTHGARVIPFALSARA